MEPCVQQKRKFICERCWVEFISPDDSNGKWGLKPNCNCPADFTDLLSKNKNREKV